MTKIQIQKLSVLNIWDLNFDIVSDFEIRYSSLYGIRFLSYFPSLEQRNGQC